MQAGRKVRRRHRGQERKITDSHHYLAPVHPAVEQINTVYPAWLCSGTSSTKPLITAHTLITTHTNPHTFSHRAASACTHMHCSHLRTCLCILCLCVTLRQSFSKRCPHITHLKKTCALIFPCFRCCSAWLTGCKEFE